MIDKNRNFRDDVSNLRMPRFYVVLNKSYIHGPNQTSLLMLFAITNLGFSQIFLNYKLISQEENCYKNSQRIFKK